MIEYYIVGDSAYPLQHHLLTPYLAHHQRLDLSAVQLKYNFIQSSTRMIVEHAFGLLKNRWKRMKRLDISLDTATDFIIACIVLHNFCIIMNDEWEEDDSDSDSNDDQDVNVNRSVSGSEMRDRICQLLVSD